MFSRIKMLIIVLGVSFAGFSAHYDDYQEIFYSGGIPFKKYNDVLAFNGLFLFLNETCPDKKYLFIFKQDDSTTEMRTLDKESKTQHEDLLKIAQQLLNTSKEKIDFSSFINEQRTRLNKL